MLDYETKSEINSTLADYVTQNNFESRLTNYLPTSDIAESLSAYAKASEIPNAHVSQADKANVLSAEREIKISGDATGNANFDGSQDITITLQVNRATSAGKADICETAEYANTAGTATNAILARISERCTGNSATSNRSAMADQDGTGRNIAATYATKEEVDKLAAKLPYLTLTVTDDGILTVNNGEKTFQFQGVVI